MSSLVNRARGRERHATRALPVRRRPGLPNPQAGRRGSRSPWLDFWNETGEGACGTQRASRPSRSAGCWRRSAATGCRVACSPARCRRRNSPPGRRSAARSSARVQRRARPPKRSRKPASGRSRPVERGDRCLDRIRIEAGPAPGEDGATRLLQRHRRPGAVLHRRVKDAPARPRRLRPPLERPRRTTVVTGRVPVHPPMVEPGERNAASGATGQRRDTRAPGRRNGSRPAAARERAGDFRKHGSAACRLHVGGCPARATSSAAGPAHARSQAIRARPLVSARREWHAPCCETGAKPDTTPLASRWQRPGDRRDGARDRRR